MNTSIDALPRVIEASFEMSAPAPHKLPQPTIPEAAFLGRSNTGKSSLLNALCNRRGLAQTGRTPGRTRLLNVFRVRFRAGETDLQARFVDLPGYGYAKVSHELKQQWPVMLESYLLERPSLAAVLLLLDCRREPGEEEHRIADLGRDGRFGLVLTKADKLSRNELVSRRAKVRKELSLEEEQVFVTSVASRKQQGLPALTSLLYRCLSDAELELNGM